MNTLNRVRERLLALAAVATVGLALGACSEPEPTPQPQRVATTTEPAPAPEPTPETTYGTFGGKSFRWSDGLEVSVGVPTLFVPTDTASFSEAAAYVQFDITIINGTGAPFDPSLFGASASSGGLEASTIFDSEQNIGGSPYTVVLPGGTVTFKLGFSVADPGDIVLQVTPSYEHDYVVFIGAPE